MPNWKKVIVSGSDAILNSIDVNGTGSVDYLEVNDRLQGNGSGFQFFAYNEDTIKTKFANWYSSNDRQYGMGQLWYETWFAAIDNQAGRDNRRIGFYLEEPNAGSTDSGTPGQHPTNSRFHVDINGAYLSGSLNVESSITGSDVTIDDWGSVSASLSTLTSDVANIDSNVTLQDATDNGSTTTNNITIDSTGDAELILDRAANSNDSEILFKTNGTTNWSIGTGQIGSETEFTFKGQDGSNYIRINQSGQADFISAVTSSDVSIDDWGSVSSSLSSLNSSIQQSGNGTVTSVGGTGTVSGLSLSGTVTTSGNLTLGGTISISSTNITDVDAFSQSGTYTNLRAQATTKGDVGLGNVENTTLSTYTGNGGALDNQYITNGAGYSTTTGTVTSVNSEGPDGGGDVSLDTDNISEGSSNLYYTDGRVKTKLNTENVISGSTFSSPSQGTVRAQINGVNTDVDTGLQVADSPTFDSLTLTGDLTVLGTKTELQVTQLNVEDLNIKVASGSADSAAANGAGLYVDGADVGLFWNHANQRFQFDTDLHTNTSLSIGQVVNAGTDTDKFLVLDSNGNVDFRTGTEVRSDIGAAGATNVAGAATEIPFFSSTNAVTSSVRLKLNKNTTTGDVLVHHGQFNVINDPSVSGTAAMQIIVGSGSSGDVSNPQYDSFISMEQESATQVALRVNGSAPTAAQFKMRTDVNDAYSIGRLTNPYGANTFRVKPTLIAEGGLSITGSLTISGSNTLRNIGPAEFSGSVSINTADQVQASTDTDKFVVLDGDQIKYRSGTEVYDDIGVTALSSSIATDIEGLSTGILTPIQLTVDTKALTAGFVPWSVLTDLQPNPDRAYTTWIAPTDGYLEKVIVSPEQSNTSTSNITISLVNGGSTVSTTQSVAMGAAGTNKTFTFGAQNYSFSAGDRLSIEFDKITNTSDLYNMMVVFRMSNV